MLTCNVTGCSLSFELGFLHEEKHTAHSRLRGMNEQDSLILTTCPHDEDSCSRVA